MNYYDIGDRIRLTATFRNSATILDSPDTVTWRVKDPAGIITTPTDAPQGAGVHQTTVNVTASGIWYYRAEGSDNPKAAGENRFVARDSAFS